MATAKTAKDNATSTVFTLDDAHLDAIAPKGRGRVATPSVYADQVEQSLKDEKAMGIAVTDTVKAPWIMAQLRKAERQYENAPAGKRLKVRIWNRETGTSTLPPFVGFQAVFVDVAAAE